MTAISSNEDNLHIGNSQAISNRGNKIISKMSISAV